MKQYHDIVHQDELYFLYPCNLYLSKSRPIFAPANRRVIIKYIRHRIRFYSSKQIETYPVFF